MSLASVTDNLTDSVAAYGAAAKKRVLDTFPLSDKESYPYAVGAGPVPSTLDLNVDLPVLIAQFGNNRFAMPVTPYEAPASSIIDVWLKPDSTYHFEVSALGGYNDMPRYEAWMHVYRIQTSGTKIQGVYQRFQSYPVSKREPTKPYTDYHFKNSHVIPSVYVPWVNDSAVVKGTVYRTSLGDLWRCEQTGVCATELPTPAYDEEVNSGFDIEASGTATMSFRGRSAYKDAWRVTPRAGISWYFSHIAAGLMAKRMPVEVKAYLKAVAFHVVDNWFSGANYQEGRKVGGAATEGRVWEAQNDGAAGAGNPFVPDAVVGDTVVDGAVTWRCIGINAHPTQKLFWFDTDPTMRNAKSPDSHDSYAACYVWAVWKYIEANPSDIAWLDDITTHAGGYSYKDLLKEIIYTNLSTQIDPTGLTKVFQGDGVPFGGSYAANFFMDNCEVYAGYYAAEQLFAELADPTYSASMAGYKTNIAVALELLWEPEVGAYRYVHGLASNAPPIAGQSLFYPRCMSQAWGALWGVPLETDRIFKCFDFMQLHYPQWWARNDIDDLLALGAHYGYVSATGNQTVREQVLERVEIERLSVDQADVYVMDGAYYLTMRDSNRPGHLSLPIA